MRMAVLAGLCGPLLLSGVLGGAQGTTTPQKPLIPAAVDSIAANPEIYYGEAVTLFAAVERIVSPVTFLIDQDAKGSSKAQLLVLASALNAPLTPNQYVTVIGEVVRQDERPAIRATAVITTAGADLAKILPPPMTPEEAAFDKTMKAIGPAFTTIRQSLTNGGGTEAEALAGTLARGFDETEAFWKKRGPAETHKIASQAKTDAAALHTAIKAGKWDEARTIAGTLQQACSSCHAAHRERLDDGSYRIRTGTGREN